MVQEARPVLFVSPHYDDVVFSCAGLMANLVSEGRRVLWVTVFSSGRWPATGFALTCQTSKGLAPEIDYMALRAEEDRQCASLLGTEVPQSLSFYEAPHRGYESSEALFGDFREEDQALAHELAAALTALETRVAPEAVFVPLGIGGHVDHRLVVQAARDGFKTAPVFSYCESPYLLSCPQEALDEARRGLRGFYRDISAHQALRAKAYAVYASQLGYQLRDIGTVGAMAFLSSKRAAEFAGLSSQEVELFFLYRTQRRLWFLFWDLTPF